MFVLTLVTAAESITINIAHKEGIALIFDVHCEPYYGMLVGDDVVQKCHVIGEILNGKRSPKTSQSLQDWLICEYLYSGMGSEQRVRSNVGSDVDELPP